ncbi:hypothetical protein C8J57DRAFT_1704891, partial [Mycena rebaudengoi]
MSSSFTDAALGEADAAIKTAQSYRASKGEKTLNVIGDKALALSGSSMVVGAESDAAKAAYGMVKDQVSQFAENSKFLVSVLEEVAKVHPFIQIAVSIFKAGIQLELTRRQNDARVVALNTTMCDMMEVLTLLKKVASPKVVGPDGKTIEDRLRGRMGRIIDSIKHCAKICDTYQQRHTAIKFFTSLKWEGKFEEAAQQFADHKTAIHQDLQIHISIGVSDANQSLASLNQNVSIMMKLVFQQMVPPEERDIAQFVEKNGGPEAVLKDEKLLKQVMDKQPKSQSEPKSKGDRSHGRTGQTPDSRASVVSDFKRDLAKDIDEILAENSRMFEQKFGAIELSLRDVKLTVVREGDRVVSEILANLDAGPHSRIIDRDLYNIWKEMGWKGSVKANHLVMAIHDYFAQKAGVALKQIHDITTKQGADAEKVRDIAEITKTTMPTEDMWALDYITLQHVQPLIEALDDDGSSFVSIYEINDFTTSRPEGWSLPRWIAYWTIGFEMTVQWYYRRIRRSLTSLVEASKKVLPSNRAVVSTFVFSNATIWTESILAGLCKVEDFDAMDWENDEIFLKFKDWVLGNEKRMKTVLRRLSYQIDQHNTLVTITGGYSGRPERYILPVVYLILERACWIMQKAHDTVLDPRELRSIESSLAVIFGVAWQRADRLQSIYRFQNVDATGKLNRVFFGLWTYALIALEKGPSWDRDFHRDDNMPNEDTDNLEVAEPPLFFNELKEEVDQQIQEPLKTENQATSADSSVDGSITGLWSGTYTYQRSNSTDGFVSLNITSVNPEGFFEGSGADQIGAYLVRGELHGTSLQFLKSYIEPQHGQMLSWGYKGQINGDFEEISGVWGYPDNLEVDLTRLTGDGEPYNSAADTGNNVAIKSSGEADQQTNVPAIDVEEAAPQEEREAQDEESETGSTPSEATDATQSLSLGTFALSRRPVDYMLYRPTDVQLGSGRISSLWHIVRNAAKYWYRRHHLVSEVMNERRAQRRAYEELFLKGGQWSYFPTERDSSQWAQLMSSLHPNDVHLWRAMVLAKQRRDPVQWSASCDNCPKWPIGSTRFCCIECSKDEVTQTLDLCSDCFDKSVDRAADSKHHVPSHKLLQLRRSIVYGERDGLAALATEIVDHVNKPGDCYYCDKQIDDKRYLICIDCSERIFICLECNKHHEETKPWCLQRGALDAEAHDYMHTMVLVGVPELDSGKETSMEERLANFEAKITGLLHEES